MIFEEMSGMKKILAVTIVATTVLVLTIGCSEMPEPRRDTEYIKNDETNNSENEQAEPDTEMTLVSHEGVDFEINNIEKEINFKDEILRQISISKTIDKEDKDYQYFADNKIWDIKEFYYPTIKIEGYELCGILLSDNLFRYYYSPVEELELKEGEEYFFNPSTGIRMWIERMKDAFASDPLKPIIEQNEEQDIDYLFKDNLIYTEHLKDIFGRIGDSRFRFRIIVPDKINNFEYLRELCFQLVDTIELVVIDK